jgi:hypothetical protein
MALLVAWQDGYMSNTLNVIDYMVIEHEAMQLDNNVDTITVFGQTIQNSFHQYTTHQNDEMELDLTLDFIKPIRAR